MKINFNIKYIILYIILQNFKHFTLGRPQLKCVFILLLYKI